MASSIETSSAGLKERSDMKTLLRDTIKHAEIKI